MKQDNKITPAKPGLDPKIDQTVLVRLAALKAMSVKDLKAEWEKLFGLAAPNNSRKILEFRIAYRIQELTYGGPDREARRMLDLLADEPRPLLAQAAICPTNPDDGQNDPSPHPRCQLQIVHTGVPAKDCLHPHVERKATRLLQSWRRRMHGPQPS